MDDERYEEINHPKHYNIGKYEHCEVVLDWRLGYLLGQATKYLCRAGYKPGNEEIKDLDKSLWYLNRQIRLMMETGERWGLARLDGRTILPRDVIADWRVPEQIGQAIERIAYTFHAQEAYLLREAVILIQQRMDQLVMQSRGAINGGTAGSD